MKITNSASFGSKLKQHFSSQSCRNFRKKSFYTLLLVYNTFLFQLSYFITLSLAGYLALSVFTKPRVEPITSGSNELDLFFTSVSAATVSSMSAMEMEVLSNSQLIILTILMLLGGEVFTSMLGIHVEKFKLRETIMVTKASNSTNSRELEQTELNGTISHDNLENQSTPCGLDMIDTRYLNLNSIRYLGYVVLGYLLVVHIAGSLFVYSYFILFSSARQVLNSKGIEILTFAVFTTVSTFANCGFVPTNENMIVFKENSGLLLLLVSQILLGNTLYPVFLRVAIWVVGKITKGREFIHMMRNNREIGYDHLLSGHHSAFLALTAFVFISVQFTLFCTLEWNSEALKGLGLYKKFVASLFEVVNSRHAGESVLDISLISPAILVLFVIMMYLPPYTTFLPIKDQESASASGDSSRRNKTLLEYLTCSNLSYLAIFVVLICITERERMKNDPLNFNVLNITIEVISAYGNVGFSTGYSCKRQLNQDGDCKDKCYGFSGKWTSEGKFILIIVMFFGRLKKFNMKGGKAWKLF